MTHRNLIAARLFRTLKIVSCDEHTGMACLQLSTVEVEKESHMIYVNQKQLDQVEYLLEQSSRGHHVLFDIDTIREVFAKTPIICLNGELTTGDPDDSEEIVDESAEKHIENLILQPTIISKRAYLENLSPETYDRVVRTYFSIVENNVFEGMKFSQ